MMTIKPAPAGEKSALTITSYGESKAADDAAPSANPATPVPASEETRQKQGGCAASPDTAHAVAG